MNTIKNIKNKYNTINDVKLNYVVALMLIMLQTAYAEPTWQKSILAQPQPSYTPNATLHQQAQKNPYLDVPKIGQKVGFIDQQQEQVIAESVFRQVQLQLPTVKDIWLENEILQIFNAMYRYTGLGKPLAVVVIQDDNINAFAVPGGLFAVNIGTITTAKHIDELAGVIAHEIAHVSQRHYSRSNEAMSGQNILALLGLLAGAVVATQSHDTAELGTAVMMGSQAAIIGKKLAYSREQEREADRIGMQYMALANYNPNSMADFFEAMLRATTQMSIVPEFWRTHPLTSARISEARLRARQFTSQDHIDRQRSQRFELIRWRAMLFSSPMGLAKMQAAAKQNPAAALALAQYYIQQAQYHEAKQILEHIQPNDVQKQLYNLTWSEWYFAQKQPQQALQMIWADYKIMPENLPLALQVAKIYLQQQKIDAAQAILQPLSQKFPQQIQVWQLLQSTAERRTGAMREIDVLCYRAEVEFWQGEEENAIRSLLRAQRLAKDKFAQNQLLHQKIDKRLNEMQDVYTANE